MRILSVWKLHTWCKWLCLRAMVFQHPIYDHHSASEIGNIFGAIHNSWTNPNIICWLNISHLFHDHKLGTPHFPQKMTDMFWESDAESINILEVDLPKSQNLSPEIKAAGLHDCLGHFRNLNWRYPPYTKTYVMRTLPQNMAQQMVLYLYLGSWNSHWFFRKQYISYTQWTTRHQFQTP